MTSRLAATVLLVVGLYPSPAVSQTRGLPEYFPDVWQGLEAGVDFGFDTAGFRTVALTGTIALGHFTKNSGLFNASMTVGRFGPEGVSSGGGSIGGAFNLLGFVQAGADYSRSDGIGRLHLIPISLELGLFGCLNATFLVRGKFGFAWDFEQVSDGAGPRWERPWGSGTMGLRLDLRNGLGFDVAFGGPSEPAPRSDPYRRGVFGVGLHFSRHNIVSLASPEAYGCHFL